MTVAIVQDKQGHTRYCYENSFKPGFEAAKDALKIAKVVSEEAT